jgi:hypothetical protein
MKDISFLEAIILINKRKDLKLCEDERELTGEYSSICVYKNGNFIGKLRWPSEIRIASVDDELKEELLK